MAFSLGTIIYVALLLTNAIAILSEERFLARSEFAFLPFQASRLGYTSSIFQTFHLQSAGQRSQRNRLLLPRTPGSARSHRITIPTPSAVVDK